MTAIQRQIRNLDQGKQAIRQKRYGVIDVTDEKFCRIRFRAWPKMISTAEVAWLGGWQHRRKQKNQCLLYYNQPMGSSNYLALKYIVSTFGTSYATFRGALVILDEVARIKRTDAIVCEVTNLRISDRLLQRFGWERHLENRRGRHFIRRFYGEFPDHSNERILAGILTPPRSIDSLMETVEN